MLYSLTQAAYYLAAGWLLGVAVREIRRGRRAR